MKQDIKSINYEWLTKPTGDPFADTGGYVIEYLSKREPEKDIFEIIEDVTRLYVNNWDAKLNTFFLNSKITQPAYKANQKILGTLKYFKSLIEETDEGIVGHCRLSGVNTKLYQAGRDNSILSGSGTLINFHHFFQQGIMMSKEMLIRMHFVPLGVVLIQGKVAVLKSNDIELNKYFVEENIKANLQKIATGTDEVGVIKSEFNNPSNAIFAFIDDAIPKVKIHNNLKGKISLTLFHFTNFGASPEVQIYQIPASVFAFYAFCTQGKYIKDWNFFVRSKYYSSKNKGAVYNKKAECFELNKKGTTETIGFNDYKTWTNWIYNKLLNGDSLLKDFLRWSRKHEFNLIIIEVYQEKIRFMKKQTIEKIKELADFIVKDKNEDAIKKSIKALDGAKNSYLLRRFILKDIIVKNYNKGNDNAIVTLDDYVDYLFPDGNSWQEVRDMLLITIYQKMHELKLSIVVEIKNEEVIENETI